MPGFIGKVPYRGARGAEGTRNAHHPPTRLPAVRKQKLCPDLILVPANFERYTSESNIVREVLAVRPVRARRTAAACGADADVGPGVGNVRYDCTDVRPKLQVRPERWNNPVDQSPTLIPTPMLSKRGRCRSHSAASLDEAYLDITDALARHPEHTAETMVQELRAEIFRCDHLRYMFSTGPRWD